MTLDGEHKKKWRLHRMQSPVCKWAWRTSCRGRTIWMDRRYYLYRLINPWRSSYGQHLAGNRNFETSNAHTPFAVGLIVITVYLVIDRVTRFIQPASQPGVTLVGRSAGIFEVSEWRRSLTVSRVDGNRWTCGTFLTPRYFWNTLLPRGSFPSAPLTLEISASPYFVDRKGEWLASTNSITDQLVLFRISAASSSKQRYFDIPKKIFMISAVRCCRCVSRYVDGWMEQNIYHLLAALLS